MSQADTYTRWGIVSSGGGGGRIAARFLSRKDNPGIEDRVTLLNTNRSDMRNLMEDANIYEDYEEHVTIFGPKRGVGNDFTEGEEIARGNVETIVNEITGRNVGADALMHVTTLGGGTGNGSIPYLIQQLDDWSDLSDQPPEWVESLVNIAFAAWPNYPESAHRHFNAVMGLSRLLMRQSGDQNADMVLLGANSHLAENGDGDAADGEYAAVNESIVTAIDLLISAGRETETVIDVEDYVAQPSNIAAYHFTPAVATGLNGRMLEYELMFDRAADQTFVPMDVSTSRAAYAVLRAPRHLIESDDVTLSGVRSAFGEWKDERDIGDVGMATVTPKETRGNDVDVLLMLGGFDLNPLLDHSWEKFESHKEQLQVGRQFGEDRISEQYIADFEDNLERYLSVNGG